MSATAAAKRPRALLLARPFPVSATIHSVSTILQSRSINSAQAEEAIVCRESEALSSASQPPVSRKTDSAAIGGFGMAVQVMIHVGREVRNAGLDGEVSHP